MAPKATKATPAANGADELWAKLTSGHPSVQLAALEGISSSISSSSSSSATSSSSLDALWRSLAATAPAGLPDLAARTLLALVADGALPPEVALRRLMAALPETPAARLHAWAALLGRLLPVTPMRPFALVGAAAHPFVTAVAQRPDVAEHLALALHTQCQDALVAAATDLGEALSRILDVHGPFVQFALDPDLHQPARLLSLQTSVFGSLQELLAGLPLGLIQVRLTMMDLLIEAMPRLPASLHEAAASRISKIWTSTAATIPPKDVATTEFHCARLVHLLLQNICESWMLNRIVSSASLALLRSLIGQDNSPVKTHAPEHAAVLAVAAVILMDTADAHLVVQLIHIVTDIISLSNATTNFSLEPMLRCLCLPLLGLASLGKSLRLGPDAPALSGLVARTIQTMTPPESKTDSKTDAFSICKALNTWHSQVSSADHAQILIFAAHVLVEDHSESGNLLLPPWHTDTIPQLSLLALSSRLFSNQPSTRSAAIDATPASIHLLHQPYLLKLLSMLLVVLKRESEATIVHNLITCTIPSLVAQKDAFLSSASIRVSLELIQDSRLNTYSEIAGVTALERIRSIQPRIWTQLKTHLFRWLQRFKDSNRGGRKKTAHELAVMLEIQIFTLAIAEKLSNKDPTTCGYDLMPFAIGYLKVTFADPTGVRHAMAVLCTAVRNDISSALAVWNVAIQDFADNLPANPPIDTLIALCEFYSVVGARMQTTEQYMLFATEILTQRLSPLCSNTSLLVKNAAFRAMAAFPPSDLYPVLQAPAFFVGDVVLDQNSPASVEMLLGSLIEHESTTMRRPVFKGLAVADGVLAGAVHRADHSDKESSAGNTADPHADLLRTARDLSESVISLYESGKVSGAARSGLAAAALMCLPSRNVRVEPKNNVPERLMPNHLNHFQLSLAALKDISPPDTPVARLEAINTWRIFWHSSFDATLRSFSSVASHSAAVVLVDQAASQLVADLIEGFETSNVPAITASSLASATGAILAAFDLNFPDASVNAVSLVDRCLDMTNDPSSSTRADLRATLLICLGCTSGALHSSDDTRLRRALEVMMACEAATRGDEKDEPVAVDAGIALAKTLHSIFSSSTLLSRQEAIDILDKLFANFASDSSWPTGLGIGLSLLLSSNVYDDIADDIGVDRLEQTAHIALTRIEAFVYQDDTSLLSTLEPTCAEIWVIEAICARIPSVVNGDALLSVLGDLVAKCQNNSKLDRLHAHALLAQSREIVRVARMNIDTQAALINGAVSQTISLCSAGNKYPSLLRQMHLIALRPLLGLDYSLDSELHAFSVDMRHIGGVIVQLRQFLSPAGDPKVARVAGWIVGNALWSLECVLGGTAPQATGRRDPRNYRRLNPDISFLRAAHEHLSQALRDGNIGAARTILNALLKVDTALPIVDWSETLSGLWSLDASVVAPTFLFSSQQAGLGSSRSFINFFVDKISTVVAEVVARGPTSSDDDSSIKELSNLAWSPDGIGRLLGLGGLVCAASSAESVGSGSQREALVSASKIIEITGSLFKHLFSESSAGPSNTWVDTQRAVVAIVRAALPADSAGSPLHKEITMQAYRALCALPDTVPTETSARIIMNLVACIATDFSTTAMLLHHVKTTRDSDAQPKSLWILSAAAVALARSPVSTAMTAAARCTAHYLQELRSAFLGADPAILSSAAHSLLNMLAALTIAHVDHTSNDNSSGIEAVAAEWLVKILDVAILVSSSRDTRAGRGVEAVWSFGIVAVVSYGWGSLKRQVISQHQHNDRVLAVPPHDWRRMRFETTHLLAMMLPKWLSHDDNSDGKSMAETSKSIVKRIFTLITCTTDSIASRTVQGDDNTAHLDHHSQQLQHAVAVKKSLRILMRKCLAGIKDHPLLEGRWIELV